LPFAEVRDRVRERVLATRGAEAARKEGMDKLAAWKANPAQAELPAAVVVSREEAQKQPQQVVEAALRADSAALPALVGVDLGAQGYAVVKVNKALPREAPAPAAALQERQQYTQWWTAAEGLSYYNVLKDRFKTQIMVAKPAVKTGEEQQTTQ
jgi:peptidyl-prolyl cis-trans isomerase D